MSADVASSLKNWSSSEGSNAPAGTTAISTNLDDNLRAIQAVVRAGLAAKGSDIASGSTTDIGAVDGLMHDITGTTTITSFGTVSSGIWKILKYEGALTLTHNASSLILLGGVNRTTANGDTQIVISEGSGNWREIAYFRVNGLPIIGDNTDSFFRVVGSSDATKKLAFEVDGLTTATTRTATVPDYSFTMGTQAKGSDVASAATLNLDTATGDLVDVTGTTTITAITLAEGLVRTVRFTGALTLTHGASLVLPAAVNITTVAGDYAIFRGYSGGVVRCVSYQVSDQSTRRFIQGADTATTSGTTFDVTGIPSWAKRITITFDGVSLSGSDNLLIQLGDSGGLETTGYDSGSMSFTNTPSVTVVTSTSGIIIALSNAGRAFFGTLTLNLMGSNKWGSSHIGKNSSQAGAGGGGTKSTSATLDRFRLLTDGSNSFDSGSFSYLVEG